MEYVGIRRSRFSFHFNTARKRRWLMVQLVTAPTLTDPSVEQTEHPTPYAAPKPERTDYHHMLTSPCSMITPAYKLAVPHNLNYEATEVFSTVRGF